MLPQNRRIPIKMFSLLQNKAKVFRNKLFLLRFVSKTEPTNRNSRFCFSISKKVAKKAVMRNKLRRTGYRLLQNYLSEIKPEILAVFSFREVPKDSEETSKNLEQVLKEAGLIK